MRLAAYNNTNAALLFVPLIYFFEWDVLLAHTHVLASPSYWVMMTLGGVFGFAIGIVTMLQIQVCGTLLPSTHLTHTHTHTHTHTLRLSCLHLQFTHPCCRLPPPPLSFTSRPLHYCCRRRPR
jgi:hypothetical protein